MNLHTQQTMKVMKLIHAKYENDIGFVVEEGSDMAGGSGSEHDANKSLEIENMNSLLYTDGVVIITETKEEMGRN